MGSKFTAAAKDPPSAAMVYLLERSNEKMQNAVNGKTPEEELDGRAGAPRRLAVYCAVAFV